MSRLFWPKDWPDISTHGVFFKHEDDFYHYEALSKISQEPFLNDIDETIEVYLVAHEIDGLAYICTDYRHGTMFAIRFDEKYVSCTDAIQKRRRRRYLPERCELL